MSWETTLDEQLALKRWWGTHEASSYARHFALDVQAKHDLSSEETANAFGGFVAIERRKLELADPVWIAPEVCDLIDAAREAGFEPEALLPSDLPCQYGFLRFDRPLHIIDARGKAVSLAALAWMPMHDPEWEGPAEPPWDRQGLSLSLYSDRDDPLDEDLVSLHAEDKALSARFVLLHRMPWWFGQSFEDMLGTAKADEPTLRTSLHDFLATMQITFRVMQQRITSSGRTRLPRAFRRRAEREGADPYTVVVTLRRYEKGDGTGGYDGDEPYYSHRFLVKGHWRAQWYPSIQAHRQLYIHAFVKGPEDAELIIKPDRAIEVVR